MNPYAAAVRTLGRTRLFAWVMGSRLRRLDLLFVRRRRSVTSYEGYRRRARREIRVFLLEPSGAGT